MDFNIFSKNQLKFRDLFGDVLKFILKVALISKKKVTDDSLSMIPLVNHLSTS